jgi:predicted MFS family arabinose efflux permease
VSKTTEGVIVGVLLGGFFGAAAGAVLGLLVFLVLRLMRVDTDRALWVLVSCFGLGAAVGGTVGGFVAWAVQEYEA